MNHFCVDTGFWLFTCLFVKDFVLFFFFFSWRCKSITLDAVGQFGKTRWSLLPNCTVIGLLDSLFSPPKNSLTKRVKLQCIELPGIALILKCNIF